MSICPKKLVLGAKTAPLQMILRKSRRGGVSPPTSCHPRAGGDPVLVEKLLNNMYMTNKMNKLGKWLHLVPLNVELDSRLRGNDIANTAESF